ncbi:MAG: hypothetical protein CL744_12240 [Chloroflexi bacterium]|nr:hypothetical protein [Chloroflexota bacterium]
MRIGTGLEFAHTGVTSTTFKGGDDLLSQRQQFDYAVGDMGINLYFMSAMTYLLFFYTDVYGLSAEIAAGVFLVARIVDAITDPIMGFIADRTRTRWGKFRPYVLFGPVPLAVIAVATFTVPDFDEVGQIIWAYVTYTLFGVIYTVVTIPYAALSAVISNDYQERSGFTSVRMMFALAGGTIVSVGMLPLVDVFGGEAIGFQWTMIVFGVMATLLLWLTFRGTEEGAFQDVTTSKVSFRDSVRVVVANVPLWITIALFCLGMLAFTFRFSTAPFYFKYSMGREDLIPLYMLVTLAVMFPGLLAVPWLSRTYGKAGAVRVGALIAMVGAVGFYYTPVSDVWLVFVWGSVLAIGGSPIMVLGWAMLADTVEHGEVQTGIRAEGVVFSTASFFQKLAKAIAGSGIAAMLAWFGFVANQEQSQETVAGLLFMIAVCPLLFNALLFLVSLAHRLDGRRHAEIVRDLSERAIVSQGDHSN